MTFLKQHPDTEVICFDFFDTLVHREVDEPEDVKRLASGRLGILLGSGFSSDRIYRLRRDLEAKICQRNAAAGKDAEFNFIEFAPEFYAVLQKAFSCFPRQLPEDLFCRWLLKIEIAVETGVQKLNRPLHALLASAHNKKYHTAVVSDFYLPRQYFRLILEHHGISGLIDAVFVSADFKYKKSSGKLYKEVLKAFQCAPDQMVMIGDNPRSDIRMAKENGLRSFPIASLNKKQNPQVPLRANSRFSNASKENAVETLISRKGGQLFPEMGITLYRFIFLLFECLIHEGAKDVLFLSKEGEFLKSLFERFQMMRFGEQIIRSNYLMVSRKSTYIASLNALEQESFIGIFQQYKNISLNDFMMSLNFSEAEAQSVYQDVFDNATQRIHDFPHSLQFRNLLGSKTFQNLYEDKRTRQKIMFLKYLETFPVDYEENGLNLIDVGWKGSIQDNLFRILEGSAKISGFYIGLLNPTQLGRLNQKRGILFTNHPSQSPFFDVYRSNTSLFEMVLGASHGSADAYEDSPDGVYVNLLDLPSERALYKEKIKPLQTRITDVFDGMNRICSKSLHFFPDETWFAKKYARMVYRPTRKESRFFKGLYHRENFGVFEFTDFHRNGKLPFEKRFQNLKHALQTPEWIIEKGIWYPVSLERAGIGFLASYFGEALYRKAFLEPESLFQSLGKSFLKMAAGIQMKKYVRIAFFLGIPEISGGTYVIFEHAARLTQMGYEVYILTREKTDPSRYAWHPEAKTLKWLTIEEGASYYFDFAIATWWQSVILLSHVSAGTYVYFVQSIESRFFPDEQEATPEETAYQRLSESTYLLPLPVITEAEWIRNYLKEKYGIGALLVRNGIRKDIYTEIGPAVAPRESGKLRVLVEGPIGVAYKNVEKAIELAGKSEADEVWLLTPTSVDTIKGVQRVFSRIPIHETAPIYRSCDVLLKLSTVEGMFGPPLEMFHCGGTVVVYRVTGHEEYIRHNVNSFVVPKGDEDGVVHYLNLLKHQTRTLERLKIGARATASRWSDWNAASQGFEKALKKFRWRDWPNRSYLSEASRYLFSNCENEIQIRREEGKQSGRECCQIFWHHGEGFSENASWKFMYAGHEWVIVEKIFALEKKQIHLRIDPCARQGVVFFKQISITCFNTGKAIAIFNSVSGWGGIEVHGTASTIYNDLLYVLESTGEDPQILIPPLQFQDADVSEILLKVDFKLLSYRQALKDIAGVFKKVDASKSNAHFG